MSIRPVELTLFEVNLCLILNAKSSGFASLLCSKNGSKSGQKVATFWPLFDHFLTTFFRFFSKSAALPVFRCFGLGLGPTPLFYVASRISNDTNVSWPYPPTHIKKWGGTQTQAETPENGQSWSICPGKRRLKRGLGWARGEGWGSGVWDTFQDQYFC